VVACDEAEEVIHKDAHGQALISQTLSVSKRGVDACSQARERVIKDQAKADTFAKAFAIFQSSWLAINILTRWAHGLPITLIELSTVAFVVYSIFTYAAWWNKPKGLAVPISFNIPKDKWTDPQIHGSKFGRRVLFTNSSPPGTLYEGKVVYKH
jgi:hypothetical protein